MRRLTTLLLAAFVAVGLAAAKPGTAHAGDRCGDLDVNPGANCAVAVNTTDGASIFKLAFAIRHVAGDVVDQQNVAVAYSSCTDCRTVAIAIEIVLVDGSPSTVTPENVAVSLNENCSLCTSFAAAYQFVVGTGEPM
jgi:putative peptide zinc metalloprotease protein